MPQAKLAMIASTKKASLMPFAPIDRDHTPHAAYFVAGELQGTLDIEGMDRDSLGIAAAVGAIANEDRPRFIVVIGAGAVLAVELLAHDASLA